ncbi:hypothetical protein D3C72_1618780 [compost metagenome]
MVIGGAANEEDGEEKQPVRPGLGRRDKGTAGSRGAQIAQACRAREQEQQIGADVEAVGRAEADVRIGKTMILRRLRDARQQPGRGGHGRHQQPDCGGPGGRAGLSAGAHDGFLPLVGIPVISKQCTAVARSDNKLGTSLLAFSSIYPLC